LVGIGLGQISEFVFVLASKGIIYLPLAKQSKIIGREIFYLLIGTTTLSMILSPILWTIVCNSMDIGKIRHLERLPTEMEGHNDLLLTFQNEQERALSKK
jgi:predicted Kef-type K+ transport protein